MNHTQLKISAALAVLAIQLPDDNTVTVPTPALKLAMEETRQRRVLRNMLKRARKAYRKGVPSKDLDTIQAAVDQSVFL